MSDCNPELYDAVVAEYTKGRELPEEQKAKIQAKIADILERCKALYAERDALTAKLQASELGAGVQSYIAAACIKLEGFAEPVAIAKMVAERFPLQVPAAVAAPKAPVPAVELTVLLSVLDREGKTIGEIARALASLPQPVSAPTESLQKTLKLGLATGEIATQGERRSKIYMLAGDSE